MESINVIVNDIQSEVITHEDEYYAIPEQHVKGNRDTRCSKKQNIPFS